MVPAWIMIICWEYLKLLVITAVSVIRLPFLWLDVFTFLCNKVNFIVFFSHEKKISQILESLTRKRRAKWTRYGGHMAKAKGERNSLLKLFITQIFWWSPAVWVIQVSLYIIILLGGGCCIFLHFNQHTSLSYNNHIHTCTYSFSLYRNMLACFR